MPNEQEAEETVAVEVNTDVLYQQDRATIDSLVATAHKFPRSIKRSTDNAIALVSMDEETAQTCTYSVPRGGKPITGPSVHLAKIIAQVWGNMRIQAKVVSIEEKQITSQSIAWDLESNLAIQVEVKRSIMQNEMDWSGPKPRRTGRMIRMSDDMVVVSGNAANSIAMRNAILSVIPKAVVNKVYKAAMQTITGDVSDENKLKARRRQVVDALIGSYKVTEEEILFSIGRASIDHIDADDIVTLIGIGTSIKDGDTTIELAFKKKAAATPPPVASTEDKEKARILKLIQESASLEEIGKHEKHLKKYPDLKDAYDNHFATLKALNS